MISKDHFDKMPAVNILDSYENKDMATDDISSSVNEHIENMIMNSNLENGNIIK